MRESGPGAEPGSINELHLGLRLHGALVRAGLFTVADIAKMDEKEILKIPGVGRKGAKELQEAIALH